MSQGTPRIAASYANLVENFGTDTSLENSWEEWLLTNVW